MSPQAPQGERFSVARLPNYWYVACRSRDLGRRPLGRTLLGTPLVLFRDAEGRAGALLDRCAHRNLPLSLGRCSAGRLECAYHGWQYDRDGVCRSVPGLLDGAEGKARSVLAYAVREQQGFVWVFGAPAVSPGAEPFRFPFLAAPGYTSVHFEYEVEATLHATLENMLDVPHTAFLHRGLFRGGRRSEVTAIVRRWPDRVEAEYVGEPRPTGLVAKLLAPGGEGTVAHFDRFLLPSISQVEYRLGESSHLFVCAALTPVADFRTRFFAVVSFRLPLPPALVRLAVTPVARRIFMQDAAILRSQTEAIRRFGGERYTSTEIDLLGPQIRRLMKEAEQGSTA
ncbi:MAG: Rieske 2Fe-2S domain-containing protein, partial [Candidatus Binatia bacterium]